MLTWCEIRGEALRHNLRVLREAIGPGVDLIAVVKANAYGHGLQEVGGICAAEGVTWFGVVDVQEAVQLREFLGSAVHLLILGYVEPEEIPSALEVEARLGIFDAAHAAEVHSAAKACGRFARVHLKVDTGMGRHGVSPEEVLTLMEQCQELPGLKVEGLWTHLAQADTPDSPFTQQQLERWSTVCAALQRRGQLPPMRHAANSAGALLYPSARGTAVRCGIILYGLWPHVGLAPRLRAQGIHLSPLLTWKSRLVQVKTVPAQTPISYGSTYLTREPTLLGVVGVGYADGFDRGLSNRGQILIRGKRCPILGRVCMKHVMVDLGPAAHHGSPQVGEEGVLLGRQGNEEVTAEEMASWLGTINYEVTTRIPERVPRFLRQGP